MKPLTDRWQLDGENPPTRLSICGNLSLPTAPLSPVGRLLAPTLDDDGHPLDSVRFSDEATGVNEQLSPSRPIYHQGDEATIGHIVACFLAFRVEVDLQRRLNAQNAEVSWPDLMRDLDQVRAVRPILDGEHHLLRTGRQCAAHEAFAGAGVRPPPAVTRLGASDDIPGNVMPNSFPDSVNLL